MILRIAGNVRRPATYDDASLQLVSELHGIAHRFAIATGRPLTVTDCVRTRCDHRSWHLVPGRAYDLRTRDLGSDELTALLREIGQAAWSVFDRTGKRLLQWQDESDGQPFHSASGELVRPRGRCIHIEWDTGDLDRYIVRQAGSWRLREGIIT